MFLPFGFGQLMVNWWFGARWFGFLTFLEWKALLLRGTPNPTTANSPLVHQPASPIQFTNLASKKTKELLKPKNMEIKISNPTIH